MLSSSINQEVKLYTNFHLGLQDLKMGQTASLLVAT